MGHLHRSVASLRIFSDSLDPAEISRLLGGTPTLSYVKGEVKCGKHRDYIRKSGAWLLDATDREPGNLESQIEEILGQLTQDLTIWAKLGEEYKIDLFCGFFMQESDEGVEISAKSLKALGERGIKLGGCLYAPDLITDGLCPCGSGKIFSECCGLKHNPRA
jgi:hypothetical protein